MILKIKHIYIQPVQPTYQANSHDPEHAKIYIEFHYSVPMQSILYK